MTFLARGLAALLLLEPADEGLHDLVGALVGLDGLPLRLGDLLEIAGIHDDLEALGVGELARLERRELRLRGAAAAEDVHVRRARGLQALVHVRRDLGAQQLVGALGEHAGDVEGDVAVADHGHGLRVELPGAGVVGVPVVPGHEVGRAVGALELDAGDPELRVLERAGRVDHRVVVGAEVLGSEVGAELDVAEEADVTAAEDPVQGGDDALDARMVGGDAVADQAERGGEAVEQVDADLELAALDRGGAQQGLCGVHTGGAGADDGQAEGLLGGGHHTSVSWRRGAGSQ